MPARNLQRRLERAGEAGRRARMRRRFHRARDVDHEEGLRVRAHLRLRRRAEHRLGRRETEQQRARRRSRRSFLPDAPRAQRAGAGAGGLAEPAVPRDAAAARGTTATSATRPAAGVSNTREPRIKACPRLEPPSRQPAAGALVALGRAPGRAVRAGRTPLASSSRSSSSRLNFASVVRRVELDCGLKVGDAAIDRRRSAQARPASCPRMRGSRAGSRPPSPARRFEPPASFVSVASSAPRAWDSE